jgi:hypothetical protein
MKKLILAVSVAAALATPVTAMAEEYQLRTRYPASVGKPGSLINPYVVTDHLGAEVKTLRPKYQVDIDPGNPDYAPGGRYNPLVPEDDFGN